MMASVWVCVAIAFVLFVVGAIDRQRSTRLMSAAWALILAATALNALLRTFGLA